MQATYDGLGRCVRRTVNGTTTLFVHDGWNPIVEFDGAGNYRAWNLYGAKADEVLARWVSGVGNLWYHSDSHGNVFALLNNSAGVMERYSYDAFGKPKITGWTDEIDRGSGWYGNRFMFQGREWIPDLGIYDYRHRIYHPGLGRFLQSDPMGFDAGDMNLFRYCDDDPVDRSDPTGLFDMWGNLKSFFSGNPSMNLVLATWNNQGPGSSRVRAENSLIGFAAGAYSYGRGVARGIDAIVDLTGIKGEEAQAEQQQAIKDITGAGRLAVEHPRAAWQITKHVVHWESQRHPERMAGRMLTGIAAGTIAIPVGKAAIPLNAVLTPLAIFGDATHNAIEVRRRAESYGMGHLLDSVLTGGSNHGDH